MSHQFEFNDKLLTFLAEDVYSCKYGNFFYNNEFERSQMKVAEKTISIWTVVQLHKDTLFKNPTFVGESRMQRIQAIGTYDSWDIRFWKEYFSQYSEPINPVETGFVPDAEKQVDLAIEEEIDQ